QAARDVEQVRSRGHVGCDDDRLGPRVAGGVGGVVDRRALTHAPWPVHQQRRSREHRPPNPGDLLLAVGEVVAGDVLADPERIAHLVGHRVTLSPNSGSLVGESLLGESIARLVARGPGAARATPWATHATDPPAPCCACPVRDMGEGNPGEAMARVDELSSVVAGQGMPSNALFELVPGEYVVLCFMPDYETGQPHVMLGTVATFTV